MEGKYFTIKNFPNDVYPAIGKIIQAAQEWERDYKRLACKLEVPIKIDNASLNKLNEALKKKNLITGKVFNDLKKVIEIRNYINHSFFLEKFQKSFDLNNTYNETLEDLQTFLNATQDLIFEATDVINNYIDKLDGIPIQRPTVFD